MKSFYAFLLLVFFSRTSSLAQPTATQAELQTHNLKWIKSKGDFNQDNLSLGQINNKIDEIINKAVLENKLNQEIEIPINTKQLEYMNYKHPNQTGLFDNNKISKANKNTPELDTTVHIYKYDDFYISTEDDNAISQQNVYYAIRAIHILKTRYPSAFKTLFISTKSYATQTPKYKDFVNSNKGFWIAFNSNPDYIASNNTVFLGDGFFPAPNNKIGKYKNISLVNIESRNILGDLPTIGSGAIYKRLNKWDNYHAYMREGLIESINHEMCHNYIDLAYTYDDNFNKIKQQRDKTNFSLAEENSILNTSLPYFTKVGGFSTNLITYYYRETFDQNINTLQTSNLLNQYGKIFSNKPNNEDNRLIFTLPILNN